MGAILNLPTIKSLNFPLTTPLNREYLENQRHTPKRDAPSIVSKIIWTNWFDFAQVAAILDFIHKAMTKVRSGHTRMSDILENPMVHTKIMLGLLFCPKWYQFIVLPCTNCGHLGFYSQCKVLITFLLHHYVRHNWSSCARHQNQESATILSKIIALYCFILYKWRPFWIFGVLSRIYFWVPRLTLIRMGYWALKKVLVLYPPNIVYPKIWC